jgi:hypothetical protein
LDDAESILHGVVGAEETLRRSMISGIDSRAMLGQNLASARLPADGPELLLGFVTKRFERVNAGICCGSVGISTCSDMSTRHLRQEQPTKNQLANSKSLRHLCSS